MDISKYDGNIHPDEWINDIKKYFKLKKININDDLDIVISLIDSSIKLSTEDAETFRNTLKEDISFTIFKNPNKRKLQSKISEFISTFRKLCYNAEINDVEEQKKYLYKLLPDNYFNYYIENEFYNKTENVNPINELIKKFGDIILEESNLIRNESVVTLKHVATGKYLKCHTSGSETQLIFLGNSDPDPNSLWKIKFNNGLAIYNNTFIAFQHIKSNKFLGLYYQDNSESYKSPTEVSCSYIHNSSINSSYYWRFNHSKLENHQGYLKSNDTINLSIIKKDQVEFLRSHDIQFTIGNDTCRGVVCHNERLGGNDEWCIELIHDSTIF